MKLLVLQTLCFAIGLVAIEPNPEPCMSANDNNGYDEFLSKHVCKDTPENIDKNEWQKFFNEHKALCDPNRTTQSFLQYKDKSLINDVCTPEGGKVYNGNLCISNNNLFLIMVKIDSNCNILKTRNKTEHIILACDKIDNVCRPVHFHGSQKKGKPMAPPCSNRRPASGAP